MNPPSVTTRFIGTGRVAAVLYVGVGITELGWWQGGVPWWLGIMALFFAGTVRTATREVKAYDSWLADWQTMGGYSAPAGVKGAKKPASRGKLAAQSIAFALMAWVIWNMTPPGQKTPDGEAVMWFLMMGGFIWSTFKLIAASRRDRSKPKGAGNVRAGATPAADVVEWILPPASSSPTRADVLRRLPEYAARLLQS